MARLLLGSKNGKNQYRYFYSMNEYNNYKNSANKQISDDELVKILEGPGKIAVNKDKGEVYKDGQKIDQNDLTEKGKKIISKYIDIYDERGKSLKHHGILGQKWGVRRYQNKDGSLTDLGKKRLEDNIDSKDYNELSTIPKGTKMYRTTTSDEVTEGEKYLTFFKSDEDFYKYQGADWIASVQSKNFNQLLSLEYTALKDVKIATSTEINSVLEELSKKDSNIDEMASKGKAEFFTRNYGITDKESLNLFYKKVKSNEYSLTKEEREFVGKRVMGEDKWNGFSDTVKEYYSDTINTIFEDQYAWEYKALERRKKDPDRTSEFVLWNRTSGMNTDSGKYVKEALTSELKKRGYDGMSDIAGIGGLAGMSRETRQAVVLFTSESSIMKTSVSNLSESQYHAAGREYYKWYRNSSKEERKLKFDDTKTLESKIKSMSGKKTQAEIAEALGVSVTTVNNYLKHHGIKGQHWGQKNGPPYPLSDDISTGKSLKEDNASKQLAIAKKMNKKILKDEYERRYKDYEEYNKKYVTGKGAFKNRSKEALDDIRSNERSIRITAKNTGGIIGAGYYALDVPFTTIYSLMDNSKNSYKNRADFMKKDAEYIKNEKSSDFSRLNKQFKEKNKDYVKLSEFKNESYSNPEEHVLTYYDSKGNRVARCLINRIDYGNTPMKKNSLWSVNVNEKYRGKGIGSQMVKEAVDKYGADSLWVMLDNQKAIKMYSDLGFEFVHDSYGYTDKSYNIYGAHGQMKLKK